MKEKIIEIRDDLMAEYDQAYADGDFKRADQRRAEALAWSQILLALEEKEEPVKEPSIHEIIQGYLTAFPFEPLAKIACSCITLAGIAMVIRYSENTITSAYAAEASGQFVLNPTKLLLTPTDIFKRV